MRSIGIVTAAFALFFAACAPAAPAPSPTQAPAPTVASTSVAAGASSTAAPAAHTSSKDTLTMVFQPNQGSLDPHFAATNQEMFIIRNVYNGLLKYKPDSTELTGDLAASWDVSADGLTYTFKLRQDVDWQKGFGHFTANDVKASFERVKNPETKSPFGPSISMLKEVQVVDDYTVKLILSEPYAAFPQLLTDYRAGAIVNVKAVQQYGKDYDWNPVGTGPYQFESGTPKQEATMVAYDKYFGDNKPAIKRVITRTVPDINAQALGLENGQYDWAQLEGADPAVIKQLTDKGFTRPLFSRNQPEVLLMNLTVKPFDDLKVRQAIAYAIDRQQLIDLALADGVGKPWYSPVPDGYAYVASDLPRYEHDIAKAKQLLADAGYPDGIDITMNVFDTMKLASDVLSEQLKQAGIRVNEEVLDQPTFISRVVTDKGINFAVHCCVRQPDPDIILSDMFSPKLRGAIYISHADLESDLAAARKELDTTKRAQLYADLEKKIVSDVMMIPLAMVNDGAVTSGSLKGLPKVEPLWGVDLTRLYFQ